MGLNMSIAHFSSKGLIEAQKLTREIYKSTGEKPELKKERFIYDLAYVVYKEANAGWIERFKNLLLEVEIDNKVRDELNTVLRGGVVAAPSEMTEKQQQRKKAMYRGREVFSSAANEKPSAPQAQSKAMYRGHSVDSAQPSSKDDVDKAKLSYRGQAIENDTPNT